jgi:hypothetical protein
VSTITAAEAAQMQEDGYALIRQAFPFTPATDDLSEEERVASADWVLTTRAEMRRTLHGMIERDVKRRFGESS